MGVQEIWENNEKSHQICKQCPHFQEECLLKGAYNSSNITILMENPERESIDQEKPLKEDQAAVMRELMDSIRSRMDVFFRVNALYAVGAEVENQPSKDAYATCMSYARRKLVAAHKSYEMNNGSDADHIIIPMGSVPAKALELGSQSIKKMRGNHYQKDIEGRTFDIYPTLGLRNLLAQQGLTRTVLQDIKPAIKHGLGIKDEGRSLEELVEDYRTPTDPDAIEMLIDDILEYEDPEKPTGSKNWPIAIDTETNTLHPYRDDAKIIMVSVSWDDEKSAAFPLDHRQCDYTESERQKVLDQFERLMASDKPKVLHNAKFDYKFIHHTYGLEVNNLWWDTMLGEHFIDESKKGYNSLKTLVDIYIPDYSGYEDKLHGALRSKRARQRSVENIDEWFEKGLWKANEKQTPGLMHFFPSLDYNPITGSEEYWKKLTPEQKREIVELEMTYLKAAKNDNQKDKKKARGKIRNRGKKWFDDYPDTVDELRISEKDGNYEEIPIDSLLLYAAADTDVTRQICKRHQYIIHKRGIQDDGYSLMDSFYIPSTKVLGEMEYIGTGIDQQLLDTYEDEISELRDLAEQKVKDIACDQDFNPASTQQKAHVIENVLPFVEDDYYYTNTGLISTKGEYLENWYDKYGDGDIRGEFSKYMLIYKETNKAKSYFVEKLRELSAYDSRIHTQFNINGTSTGRLSSSGMNLQNIPKWMCRFDDFKDENGEPISKGWNIKKAFVPTEPGNIFWQLDISSAEIRILCAYAQDEKLMDALNQGLDVHSVVVSEVFDMDYDYVVSNKESDPEVKEKRTACKRIVYGTLYGAGDYRIAEQIYGGLSKDEDKKQEQINEAKRIKGVLYDRFPKLKEYTRRVHRTVQRNGKVRSLTGRYRRYELKDVNWRQKSKAQRQAVNFKIQSASSDILVHQMCEAYEPFKDLGGQILLTVHDSIAGEIPRDNVDDMEPFFDEYIVDKASENFEWLPVPFEYDLEIGPNYGELVDFEDYKGDHSELKDKDQKYLDKAGILEV